MSATAADASDGEIVEIFVEEAGEVLDEIDRHLAILKARPSDRGALGEIRRGFHTLKGSGRMVKAMDLGELAWKVENMLNRALEGKVAVNESLMTVLGACRGAMPKLVDAFKGGRKPRMEDELELLMAQADAIASGQSPVAAAPRPAQAAATAAAAAAAVGDAAGTQVRLNELYRRFERFTQRADEALHRSEMALQQVRGIAARIDAMAPDLQDRPGRAELNPLVERVNALTRDILDLRQIAKRTQSEPAAHPRELQQLIDQRVRERLAIAERGRPDLEHQIEEARLAAAAARRLGIWALAIGVSLSLAALGAVLAVFG
jgi:chemotaxis protein histidine kinase CheA